MRGVLATLLLLSFSHAPSFGQSQSGPGGGKTDRDYDGLGAVRVVRTELEGSTSGDNKGQLVRELNEIASYDKDGRLTETITFNFTL